MSAPSPERAAFDAWFAAATFETMGTDWHWTAWQASRRQALEDAARACEATYPEWNPDDATFQKPCFDTPAECAAAIRALITNPIPTGEAQESNFGAFEDAQGKQG